MARRGRLHQFDGVAPAKTALIVVDLQNGFMMPGQPAETPNAREIVPNVNRLATATRAAGGLVVWIQNTITPESERSWSVWFADSCGGAEWGARMQRAFTPGDFSSAIARKEGRPVGPQLAAASAVQSVAGDDERAHCRSCGASAGPAGKSLANAASRRPASAGHLAAGAGLVNSRATRQAAPRRASIDIRYRR
jgi:hypothetical protein